MKIVRRPAFLLLAIAVAATHGFPASLNAESKSGPPNIIVIMADDLGWKDLHCYGNERLDTPALDQLAGDGMRFTDAYAAAPVCSPTRAAMMTGQAPGRLRLTNHAPGHNYAFHKRNRLGGVVRAGDFKLIKRYGTGQLELYNLHDDIAEKRNLASNKPKVAKRLENQFDIWLEGIDAEMPTVSATN